MSDLISREAAIETITRISGIRGDVLKALYDLPTAQPERTEYIPDIKAVRSKRDCVDLAERVVATFYDQEHEEWTQKTVTIADVLDSVCDEYTILPSAQPQRKKGRWNTIQGDIVVCSVCGMSAPKVITGCLMNRHLEPNRTDYCPNCGADMRGESDG